MRTGMIVDSSSSPTSPLFTTGSTVKLQGLVTMTGSLSLASYPKRLVREMFFFPCPESFNTPQQVKIPSLVVPSQYKKPPVWPK